MKRGWHSLFAVATIVFLVCPSNGRVAPTTLRHLVSNADLVVIGKVSRVIDVKGIHVAEVQISRTLKGTPQPRVYYLAQGTWTCDITRATVGEETLFFFERYKFDPHPATMAFVDSSDGEGNYKIKSHPITIGGFREPPGFREAVQGLTGNTPFLAVEWSGRGQMPIRTVNGQQYVTIWSNDVRLPEAIHTIDGPDAEYSRFIRSAPLAAIMDFVVARVPPFKYDVKRCTPKPQKNVSQPKPTHIQVRQGEKSSGYSPLVTFEVLESGEIKNVRLKRSSGLTDQDEYALNTVRQMRYNSRPGCGTLESEMVVLIHFGPPD